MFHLQGFINFSKVLVEGSEFYNLHKKNLKPRIEHSDLKCSTVTHYYNFIPFKDTRQKWQIGLNVVTLIHNSSKHLDHLEL